MMTRKIARFGWQPDLPDQRDFQFKAPAAFIKKLPASTDLRKKCPPVYDQGELGSCTANAIGAAFQFEQMKQGIANFMPSRLFIYYNERVIEHTINSDSGAMIRDGIKSTAKQGVPPEDLWPYVIAKFSAKPSSNAYTEARKHQVQLYRRVMQNLNQMKSCLATGYPFVLGFTVYESFESQAVAKSGDVPMPASNEQAIGGHAVLVVGYDDAQQKFLLRNSWWTGWGLQGYFTMPYAYLTQSNLAGDFWTIRMVEG